MAIEERQARWEADCPRTTGDLWDWLTAFDGDQPIGAVRALRLAHASTCSRSRWQPARRMRSQHGSTSSPARCRSRHGRGRLDARPSRTISAGSPKPRILEAVREAKGEQSAQLIDHLKKADMAKEAERLLDGTGWLPEPLRLAQTAMELDAPTAEAGEAEASAGFPRRRR